MTVLPKIYLIQGDDAPQHSHNLQDILSRLISEKRINNFNIITWEEGVSADQAVAGDMIISLLTHALEPKKVEIANHLRQLKNRGVKVAEIIIDNIPYDNEFITFPSDLKPIRSRDDMDTVWKGVEEQLKEIFPVISEEKEPVITPPGRKRWQKVLIAIVLLLMLILGARWLGWFGASKTIPLRVTASVGAVNSHTGGCPHTFQIQGKISASKSGMVTYLWRRSSGATSRKTVSFRRAGEIKIVTDSWSLNQNGRYSTQLQILTPSNLVSNTASFSLTCRSPRITENRRGNVRTIGSWQSDRGDTEVDTEPNKSTDVLCRTEITHNRQQVTIVIFYRVHELGGDHTTFSGTKRIPLFRAPSGKHIVEVEVEGEKRKSFQARPRGRHHQFLRFQTNGTYWNSLEYRIDGPGGNDDQLAGVKGQLEFKVILEDISS